MKPTAYFCTVAAIAVLLTGCARLGVGQPEDTAPPQGAADARAAGAEVTTTPTGPLLTAAPPPPAAARTQETLDTTTPAQRAQAAAPVSGGVSASSLGTTIASLGSPSEPGFWLKTPLVQTQTAGRVTNKTNGKSSAVTLIPIDGPATGGSRLSLPAMRLIEASLTDLTELDVTLGE